MTHTHTPFAVYLASIRDRVMLVRQLAIQLAAVDTESLEEICHQADVLLHSGQALLQVEVFTAQADATTQERITELQRYWGAKQNMWPSRPQ